MPTEGSDIELLHPDCFMVKHLFPSIDKSLLEQEIETDQEPGIDSDWKTLPKIIWLEHHPEVREGNIIE